MFFGSSVFESDVAAISLELNGARPKRSSKVARIEVVSYCVLSTAAL